jgi:hypothetical protein
LYGTENTSKSAIIFMNDILRKENIRNEKPPLFKSSPEGLFFSYRMLLKSLLLIESALDAMTETIH